MRTGLTPRIVLGYIVLLLALAGTGLFASARLTDLRQDLRLVDSGYLNLSRLADQARTLQDAKRDSIRRATAAPAGLERANLQSYATTFYPRALKARLDELLDTASTLRRSSGGSDHARFFDTVTNAVRRAQNLRTAADHASTAYFSALESAAGEAARQAPTSAARDAGPASNQEPQEPVAPSADPLPTTPDRAEDAPDAALEHARLALADADDKLSRALQNLVVRLDVRIGAMLRRTAEAQKRTVRSMWWLTGLGVALAAIFIVATRRALLPLAHLAGSARRVRLGERGVTVPVTTDDEVGALAREFNAMASALDERETRLADGRDELARLKAFSDDVLHSIRVGIMVVGADDRIRVLNPAGRDVFGLPLVDVQGRALPDLHARPGVHDVQDLVNQVRAGGTTVSRASLPFANALVDVTVTALHDRAGTLGSDVIVVGEDVSLREQAREQLLESERLAAVGRIAAQITHEIRNPLSSIALNLDMLAEDLGALPDDTRAETEAIAHAVLAEVERLSRISEGYLRFARLPSAPADSGDLNDVVAKLVAFAGPDAEQHGVRLELQLASALPTVRFRPDELRQALQNLVQNAIQHAGHGGTVRVRSAVGDTSVHITVDDTGPGVPAADHDRVFDAFFTTRDGGTGLGLAVSHDIVARHEGTLTVDNSDLGGARFDVRLPLA